MAFDKNKIVKPLSKNEKTVAYMMPLVALFWGVAVGGGYVYASQKNKAYLEEGLRIKERMLIEATMQLTDVIQSNKDMDRLRKIANIDQSDEECMTKTLFYEAGNYNNKDGSLDEEEIKRDMFLIASTMKNRTQTRGLSVCGVMKERKQYTWIENPVKYPPNLKIMQLNNPKKFKLAKQVTTQILSGDKKPIRFIEYYHNPKLSKNDWHTEKLNDGTFVPFIVVGENSSEKHTYYMETKYIKQLRAELKRVVNDDHS